MFSQFLFEDSSETYHLGYGYLRLFDELRSHLIAVTEARQADTTGNQPRDPRYGTRERIY
jgi:hypothetical protein